MKKELCLWWSDEVVITGIGAVTPVGNDAQTSWDNVINGRNGIGPLTRLNADEFPAKVAAEVKDFNVEEYMDKKDVKENGSVYPLCCSCFLNGC